MKKTVLLYIIYGGLIFGGLFFFFTVLNPLVVYDADDWTYIGIIRKPIPIIGGWNPTRVFPEVFMPLVSYFGVYIIMPLIHNYCFSLTIAHALFSSALIALYFVVFSLLLYKKKRVSAPLSILYGILFVVLHFIMYIHKGNNNLLLLWSINLTCFYFYILSAVINAILVMVFMIYGGVNAFFHNTGIIEKILAVICIYFAINSNLFSSVILAAYVGTELIIELFLVIRNGNFHIKEYAGKNIFSLIYLVCWIASNLLETTGGRAGDIGKGVLANLIKTILLELSSVFIINIFITIFAVVVGIVWLRKHQQNSSAVIKLLLYIALTVSYLILLSASSEPTYIIRPEVNISVAFYLLLGLILAFKELVLINKQNFRLVLILAGSVLLLFIDPGKVFLSNNYSNISYEQCENLADDIINQFKSAEENGLTEMTLIVPSYEDEGNWPLSDFAGERIANTLYNHGITKSFISVNNYIASEEKNEYFGINGYGDNERLMEAFTQFPFLFNR
ncbi:hypothetical protein [Butyrivibrio sp. WCD3002]|uniref:hypothetical protein n=1 Tax=Butyrivibrio sp. WCD3002 TaxID=1280676 RepID=UPI0003F59853|nr:hypothetical protein [Butyrivibrio sp. WCD3002]